MPFKQEEPKFPEDYDRLLHDHAKLILDYIRLGAELSASRKEVRVLRGQVGRLKYELEHGPVKWKTVLSLDGERLVPDKGDES